ncbi:hypothetical protein RA307_02515 [Xanthobacteraceae bacterium Astr-EGSB]|uniref:hypothetical protein n=1 Tax=Astrobacterium formosum TaxID=3069710 RepID=UPI0027B0136A|nr:hypothetical protein [Xanthobacteraceae bacterium Astr-EGSB]
MPLPAARADANRRPCAADQTGERPADNNEVPSPTVRLYWTTACLNCSLKPQCTTGRQRRKYYNEERPHGAIGQKPPMTLLNHDGAASPPS